MKRGRNINQRFNGCRANTTFDFPKVAVGDAQSVCKFLLRDAISPSKFFYSSSGFRWIVFLDLAFPPFAVRADVQLLVGTDRSDTCGA